MAPDGDQVRVIAVERETLHVVHVEFDTKHHVEAVEVPDYKCRLILNFLAHFTSRH